MMELTLMSKEQIMDLCIKKARKQIKTDPNFYRIRDRNRNGVGCGNCCLGIIWNELFRLMNEAGLEPIGCTPILEHIHIKCSKDCFERNNVMHDYLLKTHREVRI